MNRGALRLAECTVRQREVTHLAYLRGYGGDERACDLHLGEVETVEEKDGDPLKSSVENAQLIALTCDDLAAR